MNATTFFSEDKFLRLKRDLAVRKEMHISDTPYKHQVKINGNTYEFRIYGYTNQYTKAYQIHAWLECNYPGLYDSRNISGGHCSVPRLDNYLVFREDINKILSRFPDYKAEEQPLQMTIDF